MNIREQQRLKIEEIALSKAKSEAHYKELIA